MPLAANLRARFSSKPVVLSGGGGLALILPLLSIVSSPRSHGSGLSVLSLWVLEPQTSCLSCSDSRVRNTKCQRDWPLPPSLQRVTRACSRDQPPLASCPRKSA